MLSVRTDSVSIILSGSIRLDVPWMFVRRSLQIQMSRE